MRLWGRKREEMSDEARAILDREPPQDAAMGVVLIAWTDLATCRPIGMVVGDIPWDRAMDWCDRHGLEQDSANLVWTVIQRLVRDDNDRRAFDARVNRPAPPPR